MSINKVCMLLPPGPEQSSLMMILRRGWASANVALARTHPIRTSFLLCIALRIRQKIRADQIPRSAQHLPPQSPLEPQLQGELNQARVINRIVDHPKRAGSIDILLSTASPSAQVEPVMIEYVA